MLIFLSQLCVVCVTVFAFTWVSLWYKLFFIAYHSHAISKLWHNWLVSVALSSISALKYQQQASTDNVCIQYNFNLLYYKDICVLFGVCTSHCKYSFFTKLWKLLLVWFLRLFVCVYMDEKLVLFLF